MRLVFILLLSSAAFAQAPVGQLFSSDATVKGSVTLAAGGAQVMSGSSVSAGERTAVLKLERGGEVRVCPKTSVSVGTSQSGRDLILGLSVGSIETHYAVSASADSIVTPDFRILLAGPGRFDFAIEAAKSGNTCIRALPGNSSSLIVSELMGDATYQVKPAERLVFHNGHLQDPDHENANCGCVSEPPVMRAAETPPEPKPVSQTAESSQPAQARAEPHESKSEPPVHVEVDAPFIFHADDPTPSPLEGAISLHLARQPLPLTPLPPADVDDSVRQNVPPPVAAKPVKEARKGFFGHVKSFFASIFH